MRIIVILALLPIPACELLAAQDPPTAQPAASVPIVSLEIAPLAAADLDSPYASPRDAARHRFQATLAELQAGRDVKAAMQGFGEAFAMDRAGLQDLLVRAEPVAQQRELAVEVTLADAVHAARLAPVPPDRRARA